MEILLLMDLVHRPQGPIFQIPKGQEPFSIQQGDVVTIAYDSLKRGTIPADAVIVRKRDDLNWGDTNVKQIAPISVLLFVLLGLCEGTIISPFRWILE